MLKKIAFVFCLGSKLMALSCANSVVLSPPGESAYGYKLTMNDKGDAGVIWFAPETGSDGDRINAAVKKRDAMWTAPFLMTRNDKDLFLKCINIDPSCNLQAIWKVDGEDVDGDPIFQYGEKKYSDPSPTITSFRRAPFIDREKALSSEGRLIYVGATPENEPPAEWVNMAASILPGQTAMTVTTIAPVEGRAACRCVKFNKKGRAVLAWWQSKEVDSSFFSNKRYTLQVAREQEDGTWSAPERVCSLELNQYSIHRMKMVVDSQDNIALIWEETNFHNDRKLYVIAQQNGVWSDLIKLCHSKDSYQRSRIGVDEEGNLLVIWDEPHKEGLTIGEKPFKETRTIYAAYKPLGQPWQSQSFLTPPSYYSLYPQVAVDHKGHFVLAWVHAVSEKTNVICGTTFSVKDQKWSELQQLSLGHNCMDFKMEFSADGKGVIVWRCLNESDHRALQVADLIID